ncbi:MAG TPA: ABC transporter substrate-binding protein [Chloroflexota bacterium]|nr:ABC transporter substrate-binding protein [Chloroflexota bacterium]
MAPLLLALAALGGLLAACQPVPAASSAPPPAAPPAASAPASAAPAAPPALIPLAAANPVIGSVSMVVPVLQRLGLFQEYGLDATVTYIQSGQRTAASVIAGETPIAFSGGQPVISTQLSGGDLVCVAILVPRFTYDVQVTSNIERPEQLRGGLISSSSRGGTADMALQYLAEQWGMKLDEDVHVLATGGQPERLAALESGQVQAAMVEPPFSLIAQRMGFHTLVNLRDADYEAPTYGVITTRAYIASNEEVVRRFLRAAVAAVHRMKTDPESLVPLLVDEYKLDGPEFAREMLNEVPLKLMPRAPYPTPRMFENTIRNLALTTPEVAQLRVEDLIEPRFVRELDEGGFIRGLYGD